MNTKHVEDKTERKKLKRVARKKAAPKKKRAAGVARGSNKRKVNKLVNGQRKRKLAPGQAIFAACLRLATPRTAVGLLDADSRRR